MTEPEARSSPQPLPASARGRLPPRARAALGWALAPILATAAIAVQFGLDVPQAQMLQRAEPKRKSTRKSKPKPKPVSSAGNQSWHPRGSGELEGLRARWEHRPFADEPIDQGFRRRHEALLRSVVTRARATALDGERPQPMQIRPVCHMVRCQLELCAPEPLLDVIAEILPRVTVVEQPLWHSLRELEVEPPTAGPTRGDLCRRWLVGFEVEGADPTKLRMPE